MSVVKNKSTKENKEFWNHVEKVSKQAPIIEPFNEIKNLNKASNELLKSFTKLERKVALESNLPIKYVDQTKKALVVFIDELVKIWQK